MSDRSAEDLFREPGGEKPDGTEKFLDAPVKSNDPRQQKNQAITDKVRALKEENDLKAVLSTEAGVRLMVRLLNRCGVDSAYYQPNNGFMCEIAGRRQVANDLRDWIKNVGLEYWFKVEVEFEKYRVKPLTSEKKSSAA